MKKLAALLLLLVVPACGASSGTKESSDGRLAVVASFYPLAEVATMVGGSRASVTNLTAAGTEPHDLELSADQVNQVQDADAVIYLGNNFQPVVEKAVRGRAPRGTVDVMQAIDPPDTPTDPHVWLDPTRMAQITTAVERALSNLDPAGQAAYATGADAYRAELSSLDADFAAGLATCTRKEIVTAHEAFHYLAARYGLTQKAIAGFSPEAEPDPKRLAELADEVKRDGVTTIFTETLVSPRVAEALAREAHVKTAVLDPIEGIPAKRVRAGESYIKIMRQNLSTLREALGCS
jgi:zinc transport system substrate-binding protein